VRVVLTCNFSPWSAYSGGGQRSTHELGTALARAGHDVTVIFTRPPWERFEVPQTEYRLEWATFFDLKSRRAAPLRPLNAVSVASVVRRLHLTQPLDALHGNGEEVVLAARWAQRRGLTVVTTPRYPSYPRALLGEQGPSRAQRLGLLVTDAKYLVLAKAVAHSTWCAPTSAHAAEQVVKALGADRARLVVIPNGVSACFFEERWTRTAGERPIVFFGRLAHDKGLDVLLRALGRGHPRKLLVIGRGDEEARLRALAQELNLGAWVEWRLWVSPEALARELAGASMAVLPSRKESFGNAMAEAMAVGTPLVTTSAGSIPELVQHRVTGLLVAPDDPSALRAAITELEEQPEWAERLGQSAREHVMAKHSWPAIAQRYADLYTTAPAR